MNATTDETLKTDDTARVAPIAKLRGEMRVPGDKSISHRAAMMAALAEGRTEISNFSSAADCASTLDCLRALGVEITRGETITVAGTGGELSAPSALLDAGNSGTTMRLLAGVLAGQDFTSIITGDGSLRLRPMLRVAKPLREMGAEIATQASGCAPLEIKGRNPLRSIEYRLPVASAQIKSAILLAGLRATGRTTVIEPARTRDHTERMLQHFGVEVTRDGECVGVAGGARLRARDLRVPGDISSAAFFLAAAVMLPGSDLTITNVGLNPTRSAFLTALEKMGAHLEISDEKIEGGEPTGTLRVRGKEAREASRAIEIAGDIIPNLIDELPLLAFVAAGTNCELEVRDAAELRVKESDRIAATAENLRRMGARVEEREDGWRIYGAKKLRGAELSSYGDHRIAMACAVAALAAEGASQIEEARSAVAVSLPEFWSLLESIAA